MASRSKGPFNEGDLVQLTDPKGKIHTITLTVGKVFHTHRGGIDHTDIIGLESGSVIYASGGSAYLALRPLLDDFVLSMPRGATPVYPKDAARIVGLMNLHPGDRIAEAGHVGALGMLGDCRKSCSAWWGLCRLRCHNNPAI